MTGMHTHSAFYRGREVFDYLISVHGNAMASNRGMYQKSDGCFRLSLHLRGGNPVC